MVEVLRLKRWPVSGGDERERERRSSTCSAGLGVSIGKTGGTGLCVGVVGGVESPEPFLDLEKSLMLAGAELDEERKIPLKLRRRGDLGGESW